MNIAILVISLGVSGVFAEGALRYYRYGSLTIPPYYSDWELIRPHPTRGWSLVPGASGFARRREFKTPVKINSKGLRDKEHPYTKAEGMQRILILGDSYMQAQQVPRDQSLPRILEVALGEDRVEVINTGVNNYGSVQELIVLREEGFLYEPDVVVLAVYLLNDILNNSQTLMERYRGADNRNAYGRPYIEVVDGETVITSFDFERAMGDYSAFDARVKNRRENMRPWQRLAAYEVYDEWRRGAGMGTVPRKLDWNLVYGPCIDFANGHCRAEGSLPWQEYERVFTEAWESSRLAWRTIAEECRAKDVPLVILNVPHRFQILEEFQDELRDRCHDVAIDTMRGNRMLAEFCEAEGILLCDPTDAFMRETANGNQLFHVLDDMHWTHKGHAVATRELQLFLEGTAVLSTP